MYHVSFITDCGPLPVVVNAPAAVYSNTLLGSTASYTCNVGFGIMGCRVIKCLFSGWETEPQCVTGNGFFYMYVIIRYKPNVLFHVTVFNKNVRT